MAVAANQACLDACAECQAACEACANCCINDTKMAGYDSLIQDRCDGLIQDHLLSDRCVVTV